MDLSTALTIYLIGVVLLVWICMLSDPSTDTIGGRLNVYFTDTLPERISTALKRVLPQRGFSALSNAYDYVVNQRNPLLQIVYLVLLFGSFILYAWFGFRRMSSRDVAISCGLVIICGYAFIVACSVPAGFITKDTVDRFDNYEADSLIYAPARMCRTCDVPKLARSKHCSLCRGCIARFDHHCAWLNQCVGEQNYRYFIGFLAIHAVTFWWGFRGVVLVLMHEMREKRLLTARFWNPATRQEIPSTPAIVAQYFIVHEGALCGVAALAGVMAIVITGFLAYHLYLVSRNMTTNETFKWTAVRRVYKAEREKRERAKEISGTVDEGEALKPAKNIYDLGLRKNVVEVFWPRSERGVSSDMGKKRH